MPINLEDKPSLNQNASSPLKRMLNYTAFIIKGMGLLFLLLLIYRFRWPDLSSPVNRNSRSDNFSFDPTLSALGASEVATDQVQGYLSLVSLSNQYTLIVDAASASTDIKAAFVSDTGILKNEFSILIGQSSAAPYTQTLSLADRFILSVQKTLTTTYSQPFNNSGNAVGFSFTTPVTINPLRNFMIALQGSENILVGWHNITSNYGQIYTSNGTQLSTPFSLSGFPGVALTEGRYVVLGPGGSGATTYMQLYGSNNTAISAQLPLNAALQSIQTFALTLSNGNYVVFNGFNLQAQLFDGNGNSLGNAFNLNKFVYNAGLPAAALWKNGFAAAWVDANSNNAYARFFYENGSVVPVGDDFQINTNPLISPRAIKAAPLAEDNGVVFAWSTQNPQLSYVDKLVRYMNNPQLYLNGNSSDIQVTYIQNQPQKVPLALSPYIFSQPTVIILYDPVVGVFSNSTSATLARSYSSIGKLIINATDLNAINSILNNIIYHPVTNFVDTFNITVHAFDNQMPTQPAIMVPIFVGQAVPQPPQLINNTLLIIQGEKFLVTNANLGAIAFGTLDNELLFFISELLNGKFIDTKENVLTEFTQQQIMNENVLFLQDCSNLSPAGSISVKTPFLATAPVPIGFNFVHNPNACPGITDSLGFKLGISFAAVAVTGLGVWTAYLVYRNQQSQAELRKFLLPQEGKVWGFVPKKKDQSLLLLKKGVERYSLCYASKLPENKKQAKPGVIYVSKDGRYVVIDPVGKLIHDSLTGKIDLNNLWIKITFRNLEFKKAVWDLTTKRGHTQEYQIIEASEEDLEKVEKLYSAHAMPGYEIASVKVICSPNSNHLFNDYLTQLQARKDKEKFEPNWLRENEPEWRQTVHDLVIGLAAAYPDPRCSDVKLLPLFHSTSKSALTTIPQTGLWAFGDKDDGYFGRGIYGTPEAEYAFRVYGIPYYDKEAVLLLNWVAISSPYPVIDGDMEKLRGRAAHDNYDGHFIPVVPSDDPENPLGYFPCKVNGEHKYTEVVVFQAAACLPRYVIELREVSSPAPKPSINSEHQIHVKDSGQNSKNSPPEKNKHSFFSYKKLAKDPKSTDKIPLLPLDTENSQRGSEKGDLSKNSFFSFCKKSAPSPKLTNQNQLVSQN